MSVCKVISVGKIFYELHEKVSEFRRLMIRGIYKKVNAEKIGQEQSQILDEFLVPRIARTVSGFEVQVDGDNLGYRC